MTARHGRRGHAAPGRSRTLRRVMTLRRVLLIVTCLAVLPGVPGPASGQEPVGSAGPKPSTAISIAFEPSRMEGLPHYLAARLVAADGSAVVGEPVRIRRRVEVFGGRTVTLGQAITDRAGIARVPVEPHQDAYAITASFAGSETLAASEGTETVVFPAELVILPRHAPRGGLVDPQLRPLAEIMPAVIGLAVILVWVVLLGVAFRTLARIRSARRDESPVPASHSAKVSGTWPGPQGHELSQRRELAAQERGIHEIEP
jgi:hypothetical protein